MSKKVSRSRVGKKAGSTKNQRRKAEYRRLAEEAAMRNRAHGIVGKHARTKSKRSAKLVGTAVHARPCGNIACKECYDS